MHHNIKAHTVQLVYSEKVGFENIQYFASSVHVNCLLLKKSNGRDELLDFSGVVVVFQNQLLSVVHCYYFYYYYFFLLHL